MNATVAAMAPGDLGSAYARVRRQTQALCATLGPEDACAQSMPDASPAKWHLAHTSWFFEQFVLAVEPGYRPLDAQWAYLFNSYYDSVGPRHARPQRGLLTRPTLEQVLEHRRRIDARVQERLAAGLPPSLQAVLVLGLHHEQQHQELLLTDIKHLFACHPLQPAYADIPAPPPSQARPMGFQEGAAGVQAIGHGGDGFAFDNEGPRHRVYLQPYALAQRPVSNAEFRAFIEDGGYRTPTLWLADGWAAVQAAGWQRPLYWEPSLQAAFTLGGVRELDPHAPVCHVSYFEADAFARWAGARLPREGEWEVLATTSPGARGHFCDDRWLQPLAATGDGMQQLFGEVWEWTASPYVSYPGYVPPAGALGEYNGKFMSGQWVLRGGSCATPAGHVRSSYRNFFHPGDRWQFSGIRLARDVQ